MRIINKCFNKIILSTLCLLLVGYTQCCYSMITVSVKDKNIMVINKDKTDIIDYKWLNKITEALFLGNNEIRTLVVYNCDLNHDSLKKILSLFNKYPRFNTLNLIRCSINEKTSSLLADFIRTNKSLCSLDLEYNAIDDASIQVIAAALSVNHTLTKIDLLYNDIGHIGARALAIALQTNHTLTSIILENNNLIPDDKIENIIELFLQRNVLIGNLASFSPQLSLNIENFYPILVRIAELQETATNLLHTLPQQNLSIPSLPTPAIIPTNDTDTISASSSTTTATAFKLSW